MVPQITSHSDVKVCVRHGARVHVRDHVEDVRYGRFADGAVRVRGLVLGLCVVVGTRATAVRAQYVGAGPAGEIG